MSKLNQLKQIRAELLDTYNQSERMIHNINKQIEVEESKGLSCSDWETILDSHCDCQSRQMELFSDCDCGRYR